MQVRHETGALDVSAGRLQELVQQADRLSRCAAGSISAPPARCAGADKAHALHARDLDHAAVLRFLQQALQVLQPGVQGSQVGAAGGCLPATLAQALTASSAAVD